MISLTQEAHQKVQKDESMTSEEEQAIKRITYLEGYIQKGDDQKVTILEVPHPQSFFCMIQGSNSKSQTWHDRIQKKR